MTDDPQRAPPVTQILTAMTLAYGALVRELIQKGYVDEAAMVVRMQQCTDVLDRHGQTAGMRWIEDVTKLIRTGDV